MPLLQETICIWSAYVGPQKGMLASLVLAWALVPGSGLMGQLQQLIGSFLSPPVACCFLPVSEDSTKEHKSSFTTTPRQDLFCFFNQLLQPNEGELIAEAANRKVVLFCLAIA